MAVGILGRGVNIGGLALEEPINGTTLAGLNICP